MDQLGGLVFSQNVLLALTEAGMAREVAYKVVQENAAKVWSDGGSFQDALKSDPRVTDALTQEALEAAFDVTRHTAQADLIFKRVFG
jgi:adenylosuccinate lyase